MKQIEVINCVLSEKKIYSRPVVAVCSIETKLLRVGGEGSPPPDDFMGAPRHRTKVF